MPKEINFLRMGFAMIFGTEDMYRKTIKGMFRDAFRCQAEVIKLIIKVLFQLVSVVLMPSVTSLTLKT